MDDSLPRHGEQIALPGMDGDGPGADSAETWADRLRTALAARDPQAPAFAEQAMRTEPADHDVPLLAALIMLVARQPDRALAYLKRREKRWVPGKRSDLLTALALAQQGHVGRAGILLETAGLDMMYNAHAALPQGVSGLTDWLADSLNELARRRGRPPVWPPRLQTRTAHKSKPADKTASGKSAKPAAAAKSKTHATAPAAPASAPLPDLPRIEADFVTTVAFVNADAIRLTGAAAEPDWFRLRGELTQLGLFQGFDELLCLPLLHGVETHWYQVETARKVLKQYRGRVLLADEVGLGKTIEAGMTVKEYMLRGMAERILILTPASLVGQWRDEMAEKFSIDCATTHDRLLRDDPAAFWDQPRVIASIAVARRKDHAALLAQRRYDAVVVDEAHHLKDQSSASYQLVNSLQKRFLLLLSATPVQNNLIELYNLLTLLQPGIFKTQKEFRAAYMVHGKPREPVNREKLRDLMRGVMIRNTRALAALRLPRRHATTMRATPEAEEAACYRALTELVRGVATGGHHRMASQHLLSAAGSSPAAAAVAIARFHERHDSDKSWAGLADRYAALGAGAKQAALLDLLQRNPAEKKMVFVHHRESLTHLADLLSARRIDFVTFDGSMSGPDKDAAVAAFRDSAPVLLCSESGGEGRNLQFCNTLINFDIPWNPMAIEQRIGRIDRIGQQREVFVFNLATSGTIEDQVLRILDEKINMFELVVGEVGAILGALEEQQDFSTMVLDAWLQTTDAARDQAFAALEDQLTAARRDYEDAKQLDEALFGNELDAA
ncbi:MAG TPA: SNF2-related protein [Acetobacteraceae bacterium]|nr:SNF2-related protein [Acetobacteraceae bacterium]